VRILALDHGTVRIGVAVSDELKLIATHSEADIEKTVNIAMKVFR